EKVPAPARRVEHAELEETLAHLEQLGERLSFADLLPPRVDYRGADDTHDVVVRRVVRATLVALRAVHDALKDASEEVRVDVLPVRLRRFRQRAELGVAERQRYRVCEEPSIEERYRSRSWCVLRAHQPEQLREALVDITVARAVVEERREVLLRQ